MWRLGDEEHAIRRLEALHEPVAFRFFPGIEGKWRQRETTEDLHTIFGYGVGVL